MIRSGLVAGVAEYKYELASALLVSVKVQECNLSQELIKLLVDRHNNALGPQQSAALHS